MQHFSSTFKDVFTIILVGKVLNHLGFYFKYVNVLLIKFTEYTSDIISTQKVEVRISTWLLSIPITFYSFSMWNNPKFYLNFQGSYKSIYFRHNILKSLWTLKIRDDLRFSINHKLLILKINSRWLYKPNHLYCTV